MSSEPQRPLTDLSDDPDRGPYDPEPVADEDLWFLPDPDLDDVPDAGPGAPLPRAESRLLFDPADWRAAQDRQSDRLAALALAFGALDQRLRSASAQQAAGWRRRLALSEVADLGWWTGARISVDRLALWLSLRLVGAQDDALALARAGWAVRRLSGGPAPDEGGWSQGLAAFLGRARAEEGAPASLVGDLSDVMAPMDGLHPAVQAAVLFHAARMLAETPAHEVEAATIAARHGAAMASGLAGAGSDGQRALFLPLALSGPEALRAAGTADEKLGAWLRGAERATLAAHMQLDRTRAWQERADAATEDLSGRTPPALIAAFAAWPLLTAPMAEAETGASRAAVQRNIDILRERDLIREVTGQGRYRVWAARV